MGVLVPEVSESLGKRLWPAIKRGLLFYFRAIGILSDKGDGGESAVSRIKQNHISFRRLLTSNNEFLEIIAELEQKQLDCTFITLPYITNKVVRSIVVVQHMINNINVISDGRYNKLEESFRAISNELEGLLNDAEAGIQKKYVYDMSEIVGAGANVVGGKMASLGEVRNKVGLPTPDGFAIATQACNLVLENAKMNSLARTLFADKSLTYEEAIRISGELREEILGTSVSAELGGEIREAFRRLEERMEAAPRLAVRSSAIREDTTLSFAGQFLTVLNVDEKTLEKAYLEVLASLFSPEAITYQMYHGLSADTCVMAAGCVNMVDAVASGIIFSNDPNYPEPGQALIHAVWGLGVTLAEGMTSPEEITLSREDGMSITSWTVTGQRSAIKCAPGAGVVEEPISEELAGARILTESEAHTLAEWAMRLEKHFETPQDIEWAMDSERRFFVLQSRPLRVAPSGSRAARVFEDYPTVLDRGSTACPGIGAGPAVHMDEDADLESFPDGGILVAKRSSPKFVRVMARARAIVTDAGSVTGHMASIAREFGVPTLLNTGNATRVIADGTEITVDATNCCVYKGIIPFFVNEQPRIEREKDSYRIVRESPEYLLLNKILSLTVPLNLVNPHAGDFTIANCRTLHDIARYIHEMSYAEMFRMGETLGDCRSVSYLLDVFLPIDLHIIDIDSGIIPPEAGRKIKPSNVTSFPLKALLKGMLCEKIPRYGSRKLDAAGFFTLMMEHATTNPEQDRTFRDPCYAIAGVNYLNYTARVGYHFGVIDTYCGNSENKNYINLLFRGGAADIVRKNRRARAIAGILKHYGFSARVEHDTVTAYLRHAVRDEIERHLEMLGRLLQFMRQMDVSMDSDETARWILRSFLDINKDAEEDAAGKNNGPDGDDSLQPPRKSP